MAYPYRDRYKSQANSQGGFFIPKGGAMEFSEIESSRLTELETVIEHGLKTFVDVGNALLEIRDSRLYRAEHGTFEDYCRDRWGMSRIHAHRMIEAASVTSNLLPIGNILPANEAQARPLTQLPPNVNTP